jgi:hypothetical protein
MDPFEQFKSARAVQASNIEPRGESQIEDERWFREAHEFTEIALWQVRHACEYDRPRALVIKQR